MVTPVASSAPEAPLAGAQSLRRMLATPVLAGAEVVAGHAGLDRLVERLNVMEVPDILPWVKPREFLLTTAYPLREAPDRLTELVTGLDDAGLAGLGVKLGRYLDELPAGMLEAADERGFPLVRLPDGVSFDDVFDQVLTGILNRQADLLARAQRIHRTFIQIVLDGDGLDEIVTELSGLVDAPAAIVARDGEVLAQARCRPPADGDTPSLRLVGDDHVELDGRRRRCLTVPISAGPRLHGYVVAVQEAGPVDDRAALESAAIVAALAITKQHELVAVESKYQSDLMHDLLTGRVDDPADALARAKLFGWELDRPLTVLVARFDDPASTVQPDELRAPLGGSLRDAVRQRDPGAAVVRFSNEVVVLTAAFEPMDGDPTGRAEARALAGRLTRAAARAAGLSVSGGVSRPVGELRDIPRGYAEAERALTIGRGVQGRGAVAHFDDLGVHRLLSLIDDVDELTTFAAETLGELAGESEHARDLRHTLQVLLETNLNVAEAARRLHFHYNTLRYRIDKLERIVGPFTDDARVRLDVHVALLLLETDRLQA